jgi:hypothetical protein
MKSANSKADAKSKIDVDRLDLVENGTSQSETVSKDAICNLHFSFFSFHFAMLFPE